MTDNERQNKLDEEDMKRVEEYLSSPIHQVDRKPFRPWLLLLGLWVVVAVLGLVSLLLGRLEGFI